MILIPLVSFGIVDGLLATKPLLNRLTGIVLTISLIISVVVIPVVFMARITNQIPQKVECGVEGQRPATVRKDYLDTR